MNRMRSRKNYLNMVQAAVVVLGSLSSTHASATVQENTNPTPVVHAHSCQYIDVASAVSEASDLKPSTVQIPEGTCEWNTDELILPAGVELKGAGRGLTTIKRTGITKTFLIRFLCVANDTSNRVKFSHISLVGSHDPNSEDRGLGLIGGCIDFSVGYSSFSHFTFAGIEVRGAATQRGVIFQNDFIKNYRAEINNLGYGIALYGNGEWSEQLELGTRNAVFVEDNLMIGNRHHIASNNGAKYVFRHNEVHSDSFTKGFQQIDAHAKTLTYAHGTRSFEIYRNKIYNDAQDGSNWAAIAIRGGDGVIFENQFFGPITHQLVFASEGGSCENVDKPKEVYLPDMSTDNVMTQCNPGIVAGNNYFFSQRPGYLGYEYPHPLRKPPYNP